MEQYKKDQENCNLEIGTNVITKCIERDCKQVKRKWTHHNLEVDL